MAEDIRQHLTNLKDRYERRLRILETQAATLGHNTPPEVIIETEDIQAKLEEISRQFEEIDLKLGQHGTNHNVRRPQQTVKTHKAIWRPWGDHPVVVTILIITAVLSTILAALSLRQPDRRTE